MSVFTSGLVATLATDSTLTGLLSTYKTKPAIFSADPIPADALRPYLVISPVSDTSWDTKNTEGRDMRRDVRAYCNATGSMAPVETIAERIRTLLHRKTITITGYQNVMTFCEGPLIAPTDQTLYGLVVTVRLVLKQN